MSFSCDKNDTTKKQEHLYLQYAVGTCQIVERPITSKRNNFPQCFQRSNYTMRKDAQMWIEKQKTKLFKFLYLGLYYIQMYYNLSH